VWWGGDTATPHPYASAAGPPEQLRIVDDCSNPEDIIKKKRHPG
jgi:hypothetical protein